MELILTVNIMYYQLYECVSSLARPGLCDLFYPNIITQRKLLYKSDKDNF